MPVTLIYLIIRHYLHVPNASLVLIATCNFLKMYYIVCMYVCACVVLPTLVWDIPQSVWRSEDNLWFDSLLTLRVPGIKLRWLGLATSTFITEPSCLPLCNYYVLVRHIYKKYLTI